MISRMEIKNFRCLNDVSIFLEDDVTVIVGENDSGKTSFIDAFKILFENEKPEEDDFFNRSEEIIIKGYVNDKVLIKKFNVENLNHPEIFIEFSENHINDFDNEINSLDFDSLNDEQKKDRLSQIADELGVNIARVTRIETLTSKVLKQIESIKENGYLSLVDVFPEYSTYFLGGKEFQRLDEFFENTFFKDIKRDIWKKQTDDGVTIENLILSKLDEYTDELIIDLEEKGIIDTLKQYLTGLTNIKVESNFNPRDINIDVKIQLLEGDKQIYVNKRGDGTQRRITMALLEYEKESTKNYPSIYVFDEPDTHLHVKAQYELLDILRKFNELNRQVLITTHSPFIMNSVKPEQLRFLYLDEGQTNLRKIVDEDSVDAVDEIHRTLNSLGIANTNLFFSRKVLIVEGHTEKKFINSIFPKFYGVSIHSKLVKIIRADGIQYASRLAKVLEDFIDLNNIYLLIDNDGDKKILELLDNLKIPEENIFTIGHKEFEDLFAPQLIFESWKDFIEDKYGEEKLEAFHENWNVEKISELKEDCLNNNKKFSAELIKFSAEKCLVTMEKPNLGIALAHKAEIDDLDNKLRELLVKLEE